MCLKPSPVVSDVLNGADGADPSGEFLQEKVYPEKLLY